MADVRIQNSEFRALHLNSEFCILTSAIFVYDLVIARRLLELLPELQVGLVPLTPDNPALNCRVHRAPRLHAMRAVAEATLLHQWTHLRKASIHLSRIDSPHSDLAQSWSVHDVATVRQRVQIRTNRRMTPLHHRATDFSHSEIQTRIHRIQQR